MKTYDLTQRRPDTNGACFPTDRAGAGTPIRGKGYSIIEETISSVLATVVLAVVVSGLYPLLVWGLGQGLFNHKANGSLIVAADGKTVLGSELLGQNFGGKTYFNPRPSAAGAAGYDPTASGGTNLGPTSDKLVNGQHKKDAAGNAVNDPSNFDGIKDLVAAYRTANGLKETDAGARRRRDPLGQRAGPAHLRGQRALQLPRVARERGKSPDEVRQLMDKYTEGRDLGVFGEPRVNILLLNLALDGKLPSSQHNVDVQILPIPLCTGVTGGMAWPSFTPGYGQPLRWRNDRGRRAIRIAREASCRAAPELYPVSEMEGFIPEETRG